jgi:hypothetical protein
MLKDEQWMKLQVILIQIGIYLKPKLRLTMEGIKPLDDAQCLWWALAHTTLAEQSRKRPRG